MRTHRQAYGDTGKQMSSWQLFLSSVSALKSYNNPIFMREAGRRPGWYLAAMPLLRTPFLNAGIIIVIGLMWFLSAVYLKSLLVVLLIPYLLLITLTSLTLAPIIARERISHTWEGLLATPLGSEKIVLGKIAGVMWWLQPFITFMGWLLIVIGSGIGLISLVLIPPQTPGFMMCLGLVIVPIAGAICFVMDRVQQYILILTSVVATSASPAMTHLANFAAITSMMLICLLETTLIGLLLVLIADGPVAFSVNRILLMITMGPVVSYVMSMPLLETILCTALTFLVRETAIRALWRWMVQQASTV